MTGPADLETDSRGILHPRAAPWQMERFAPHQRLKPYVEWYWAVRWDLGEGQVFEQPVLPHPGVNVVWEPLRALVCGVPTHLSSRALQGSGWAIGVLFRPGAFRAFWPHPVSSLTDSAAGVDLLGPGSGAVHERVVGAATAAQRHRIVDDWLLGCAPEQVPPATRDAVGAAALAASDRSIVRAQELATRVGRDLRSLQRLFAEHVGLSPKQVLHRYRLLEAAETAARGTPVAWDELALSLGFSDQAHLVRDFTAAFGTPPARYAADCRRRAGLDHPGAAAGGRGRHPE